LNQVHENASPNNLSSNLDEALQYSFQMMHGVLFQFKILFFAFRPGRKRSEPEDRFYSEDFRFVLFKTTNKLLWAVFTFGKKVVADRAIRNLLAKPM